MNFINLFSGINLKEILQKQREILEAINYKQEKHH